MIGLRELERKAISADEKRKLLLVLTEMKARGLPLPQIEIPQTRLELSWNIGSNGYFVNNDGRPYIPNQQQEAFIKSKSRYVGYFGGRGSGKTAASAQKALRKIQQGESGAVLNPSFENFRTSTWPELRTWIPWNMVIPKHRHRKNPSWDASRPFTVMFQNGARMLCKGLKDADSARGPNLNWLWYDEAAMDRTGLSWKIAIASIRVGKDPQAWASSTPKGLAHWAYLFFVKQEIPEEVFELVRGFTDRKLIEYYHGSIEDNKANLDPMFYASILAGYPSGWLRAQEVMGEFANEEGSLGDRAWFNGHYISETPSYAHRLVRFWDLAASEKKVGTDPDETIGSLVCVNGQKDKFALLDQFGGHWLWDKIKSSIVQISKLDGNSVEVYFEQEPASGGKNQVAELRDLLRKECPHVRTGSWNPKDVGDRIMGANTWFAESANGNWEIKKALWNEKFFTQLETFNGDDSHDDRITSVTGARHVLAPVKKWQKISFLSIGR